MKIALCGLWHVHAPGYFNQIKDVSEIVGVYEENEKWRRDFCEKHGVKEFTSLDELLASDAEGVVVCTATNKHCDTIVRIAEAGKHIFTEKVLGLSDEECERVEKAVRDNKVNFVISLVHKYSAGLQTVKKIADSGELGKINYLRFRNCHTGSTDNWLPKHFYDLEECGGGAMIDLGAHGMYLTDWILGMPDKYTSVYTLSCTNEETKKVNTDQVEDNAVTVMTYANGCIAVNETGFVSRGCPMSMEVGGENGYVYFDNTGVFKNTKSTEGKKVSVELCDALPSPLMQFATGNILEGCGIEEAKHLTHMMVEAYANRI